jgi:competence protein ComEC
MPGVHNPLILIILPVDFFILQTMFYWSKFPFVRVVIFFALGILLGIWFAALEVIFLVVMAVSLVGFALLILNRKSWMLKYNYLYGLTLSIIFTSLGYLVVTDATQSNQPNHISHLNTAAYITGTVISEPQAKGAYSRMKIEINAFKTDFWQEASGIVLAYLPIAIEKTPAYGDKLIIKGFPVEVSPPQNPGAFDYRQYLANNNIYHQLFIREDQWRLVAKSAGFNLRKTAIGMRQYLEAKLTMFITGKEELAIAKALILGKKEELDNTIKEVYAQAGVMHVLAVSGLHVGIIYIVLLWILGQKNGRVTRPVLVAGVVIPALWFYALITGLSPSVLRAVTMFSFLVIAQALNRRSATLNSLAISAFILLLINPLMIMSVGFQLSYIAVVGIIFLYPVFEAWFQPSNRVIRFIWQLTALSLAAQVATFPLSVLYFHRFPTYFLLANLLVIPAAIIIVWGGLILLSLGSISTTIGIMLGKVIGLLIWLVNQALHWLAGWPYANLDSLAPTIADTWVVYGIIFFIFLFIYYRKWTYYWISFVLVVLLSLSFFYNDFRNRDIKQIVFYSVGRGWAIDFIEDKKYVSVIDPTLAKDKGKIDYHLLPYRRNLGLVPGESSLGLITVANLGEVFVWHGHKILLANPCLEIKEIPEYFDFVLYKIEQTTENCYQDQILLRKFVDNRYQGYSKYNLRTKGALIVDI